MYIIGDNLVGICASKKGWQNGTFYSGVLVIQFTFCFINDYYHFIISSPLIENIFMVDDNRQQIKISTPLSSKF